ncbi:MAG: class I SAM-dependent methyltransferase [Lentimicrobiaceae bacterium]|nr:class I SAM-dependent methyltransferase [Lentimicrobiaceae bacterium]
MEKKLKKNILQWDVKSWSKAIDFWEDNIDWNTVENGLELGAREGGLSLWLALKGKKVVCSDLKDVQKTAEPIHNRYNVKNLIVYEDIDGTQIPYENYFDIIVFKSIVGGIGSNNNIEKQYELFKEIFKALKPNGKLLFAENLIASPIHQILRKKYIKWGNRWRYVSLEEMKSLLTDFSSYQLKATGIIATFGRNEKQRAFLSIFDKILLNFICPKSWNYIAYGIAEK